MSTVILNGKNTHCFSTRDVSEKDSFSYWNEIICKKLVNVDCERPRNCDAFYGSIRIEKYEDLVVSEIRSKSTNFIRKKEHIAHSSNDFMFVTCRLGNKSWKMIGDKSFNTLPGDISIYHGARESRLHIADSVEALIYKIPMAIVGQSILHPENLHGSVISGESRLGKLASNYMLSLASEIDLISPPQRLKAIDIFLQSLSLCTTHSASYKNVTTECFRESLINQIKEFIVLNAKNQDLCAEYIATRFNISVRYLYNLFNDEKMSPAQLISDERLILAKTQLLQNEYSQKSISEIAYNAGFNNVSHFCKQFKRKFNVTPSEIKFSARSYNA